MRAVRLAALAAVLAGAGAAQAQEAMFTEAATMPSPGTGVFRQSFHYFEFGRNPVSGSEKTEAFEAMSSIQWGLKRDLSVLVEVPLEWRRIEEPDGADEDFGVEDIHAMLKWRFYRSDTGGIDTLRAALMAGAAIGTPSDLSSQAFNPMVGAVVTRVLGRHGFNQDLFLRVNTGGDDEDNLGGDGPSNALFHNTSYLYRIIPDRFRPDTTGAWYVTVELNGIYETNGDYELRWAPGLMYEGRLWALEFMGQFPLYDDLDRRAELDWGIGAGVRFSF